LLMLFKPTRAPTSDQAKSAHLYGSCAWLCIQLCTF
jgi:hypothetical protein